MELDWTTFALEIINFLVLVWMLKRFLYRPVLATLAERRAGIERTLAEARADAKRRRRRCRASSRAAWPTGSRKRRRRARGFEAGLAAERARQMEALSRGPGRRARTQCRPGRPPPGDAASANWRPGAAREARAVRQRAARPAGRPGAGSAAGANSSSRNWRALPEERLGALRAGQNGHGHSVRVEQRLSARRSAARSSSPSAVDARLGELVAPRFRRGPQAAGRCAPVARCLAAGCQPGRRTGRLRGGGRSWRAERPARWRACAAWSPTTARSCGWARWASWSPIGDGIAWIEGLPSAAMDEILRFEDGSEALVFDLGSQRIGAILLDQQERPRRRLPRLISPGERLDIGVGDGFLGRVVDPLGNPLDGGPPPQFSRRRALEVASPPIIGARFRQSAACSAATRWSTR